MAIRELDDFGCRQYGLVSKAQVEQTGHQLDALLRMNELEIVHVGVYRMPGAMLTREAEIMAAVLASPEGTVGSHYSAARLHRLSVDDGLWPHVTVPGDRSRMRPRIESHYSFLDRREIQVVRFIPCTGVERTIIDLAGCLPRREVVRVLDDAVVADKTTYKRVAKRLQIAGSKGRKGTAFLKRILNERLELVTDKRLDSKVTLKVLKAAKLAGMPPHVRELPVGRYFIDVAWPSLMLGAEADGFTVHGRSKKKFDDDRQRHNEITAAGFTLLHFTARMSVEQMAQQLSRFV